MPLSRPSATTWSAHRGVLSCADRGYTALYPVVAFRSQGLVRE